MKIILVFTLLVSLYEVTTSKAIVIKETHDLTDVPVISIDYYGANTVWFIDRIGRDLHFTSNGGKRWHKSPGNLVDGFWKISFLNATQGWALCGDKNIWKTNDGGRNWIILGKVMKQDEKGEFLAQRLKFISKVRGWLIDTQGRLWYTEDGGRRWSVISIWERYRVEIL
jgi:photosystem II stability/assembly factor-like uncharacterized protein